jgi:hypothetical protein
MSRPKLHHYVPQFYLSLFADKASRLWVWDKKEDRIFQVTPVSIAADTNFYRFTDLSGTAKDPFLIEKELAKIEGHAASIMAQWHDQLETMKPLEKLRISKDARNVVSLFLALQYLRTLESREILVLFALENGFYPDGISDDEKVNLHAALLLNGSAVEGFQSWIKKSIWIFAENLTDNPFLTSDNPVCFKTADNRMWLKAPGILSEGNYLVYPLTSKFILYCKDGNSSHWRPLRKFRDRLSPVVFSEEMVDHENSGQVFMASRFVISPKDDFSFPRSFARDFLRETGTPI